MDMGRGCGGRIGESGIGLYIHYAKLPSGNMLYSTGSSIKFCDDLEGMGVGVGWEGGTEGGDICTQIADSHHCTAETNTL